MSKLSVTTSVLIADTEKRWPALIEHCIDSWPKHMKSTRRDVEFITRANTPEDNLGVTGSLQWCYEHSNAPIIAFFHSDLQIFEHGWDQRVLKEFDDPMVGVVGFGGALQLAEDDIYKKPYELHQLRRIGYLSNVDDWITHGERFTGEMDVATLDGFALVVRRELLFNWRHSLGAHPMNYMVGWPIHTLPFHNYDNALCIEAHRQGYRVRLVGVHCHHHGGQTVISTAYQDWCQRVLGKSDAQVHEDSHRVLYEMGRGILPIKVK